MLEWPVWIQILASLANKLLEKERVQLEPIRRETHQSKRKKETRKGRNQRKREQERERERERGFTRRIREMENGESSTWLIVNFWSTSIHVLTEQKKKNKRYLSTGFCFNYLQFSMRKYSLQIELRLFMRLRKILQRKIILTNTFYIHRSLFSSFPNLTSRLLFFFFFFLSSLSLLDEFI